MIGCATWFNVTQERTVEHRLDGPWLVLIDEMPLFDELLIQTHVNGSSVKTTARDDEVLRRVPDPLSVDVLRAQPGDVIYTGTRPVPAPSTAGPVTPEMSSRSQCQRSARRKLVAAEFDGPTDIVPPEKQ